MTTSTLSPVARREALQDAANQYIHGKIDHREYEERVSKYSPSYRPAPPPAMPRGSIRNGIRRALGLTK